MPSLSRTFLIVLLLGTGTVRAGELVIETIEPSIDYPDCDCGSPLPAELPIALYDYSDQPTLDSLFALELTMTMEDAETAPGEMDYGQLQVALEGVPTGLFLDGYPAGLEVERTLSITENDPGWMSKPSMLEILGGIQADGELLVSILDASPDDNIVNLYSDTDITLRLWATTPMENPDQVPEPASMLVWLIAVGAVGLGRRFRR